MEQPLFSIIHFDEYEQKRRGNAHQGQRAYNEDIEPSQTFQAFTTNHYMRRRNQALTFEMHIKNIDRSPAPNNMGAIGLELVILSEKGSLTNFVHSATISRDTAPDVPQGSAIWTLSKDSPLIMHEQGSIHQGFMLIDDLDKEFRALLAREGISANTDLFV